MEKLSNSEFKIMAQIWNLKRPVYLEEILDLVEEEGWAESTVRNFLRRIVDKGYLEIEKDGRKNIYRAKVERDYVNRKSRGLIERLYQNSLKNFVSELYDSKSIDQDDLLELRAYLDEKIGGATDG